MTNKISLTQEKINVANDIIKNIEYDVLDASELTNGMLKNIVEYCNKLLITDF